MAEHIPCRGRGHTQIDEGPEMVVLWQLRKRVQVSHLLHMGVESMQVDSEPALIEAPVVARAGA